MPRLALLLSLPVLGLGLAACGDQTKDLEKNATEELSSRGYADAKVECPSDVDSDKGGTFTCTISGVPKISAVTYKVVDDDGNVSIESIK
jgi:hypothetical protein